MTFGSESDRWQRGRVSANRLQAYGGPGAMGRSVKVQYNDDGERREMDRIADALIAKCDALCETFERKEGKGVAVANGKANGSAGAH